LRFLRLFAAIKESGVLDADTKARIDSARDILVGKVTPKSETPLTPEDRVAIYLVAIGGG